MGALVWLRRDLRLQDNPALSAAVASGLPVEAVFVYPQNPDSPLAEGAAARWYLHHSLASLHVRLAQLGIPLHLLKGAPDEAIPNLCNERCITRLYWNRLVDPNVEELDDRVQYRSRARGVTCERFSDDCLVMPEDALKADGSAYRVFTPFWRNLRDRVQIGALLHRLNPVPDPIGPPIVPADTTVQVLGLLPLHPWHEKLQVHWTPGESSAQDRLADCIEHRLQDYAAQRDFPAVDGTSRLSPALHFGELSVARVYASVEQQLLHEPKEAARASLHRFLSEIGWREFARHVLHAFPRSVDCSLNPLFDKPEAWEDDSDDERLLAWQRGETGIALVDAGMRQLWETGWVHNRVRMVVASFLTKNLGIHWREGARWFADLLVDADCASNTLGWQWVAGCGTDAAPYYRIFNPDTQARKFDPSGRYIAHWLGRRREHMPPIIDLKLSRARALERYRLAIKQAAA
jgi:deoxyribodipyrimidine photo-lyase